MSLPQHRSIVRRQPLASWPLVLMVLSYLLFTVYLAYSLNVWIDEAYTLSTTSLALGETAQRALTFENQPPLYFVLLRLWRFLGTSPFFARIPSILCTLAFLLLVYRFAAGTVARSVFFYSATLPLVIWAAVEIRVYALALLLAIVTLVSFDRFVSARRGALQASVLHGSVVALGLYTYSFLGFLVPGNLVHLMSSPGLWPKVRRYVVVLAVAGASALPAVYWSWAAAGQVDTALPEVDRTLSFAEAARLTIYQWEEHLVPVYRLVYLSDLQLSGAGASALYWGTRALLVVVVLLAMGDSGRWRRLLGDAQLRWILTSMVCLALQLTAMLVFVNAIAASVLGDPAARVRHTSLLLVPTLMMLGLMARHLRRPRLFGGMLVVLGVLNCLVLAAEYREPAKRGDSRRVAEFLELQEAPGEPVLVFPSEEVLPLRVHYRGVNRMLPIPEEPSLVHYRPPAFQLRSEARVGEVLNGAGEAVERVWLVYNRSYTNWGELFDIGAEHLESYLWSHFEVELEREFRHGVVVMRLARQRGESARVSHGSTDQTTR